MSSRFLDTSKDYNRGTPLIDIRPNRVMFIAQGGWSPQVRRVYEANSEMQTINRLGDVITRGTQQGRNINMMELGSIAGAILKPSTQIDKRVSIVNGWDSPRFSFSMEFVQNLRNGKEYIHVYNGFTDYLGADWSGNIDPNMILHITSVHSYMRESNRNGMINAMTQSNNAIIVSEKYYADPTRPMAVDLSGNTYRAARYGFGQPGMQREYLLDPSSVFVAGRRNQSLEHMNVDGSTTIFGEGTVTNNAIPTMRQNANPSFYLSQMINHISTAQRYRSNPNWGENTEWGYDGLAAGQELDMVARELKGKAAGNMSSDPLFSLYSTSTSITNSASLRWKDLISTFPYIEHEDCTTLIYPETMIQRGTDVGNAVRNSVYNGHDQDQWSNTSLETIVATSFQQQLPALMLAEQIKSIRFTITNLSNDPLSGERFLWTLGNINRDEYDNRNAIVFMINHDFNMGRAHLENFKIRVERTLIDGLFPDNDISFTITVDADTLSGCHIWISVDGGEFVQFDSPFFMSSATSPYVTSHVEVQNDIANTLMDIVETVVRPL